MSTTKNYELELMKKIYDKRGSKPVRIPEILIEEIAKYGGDMEAQAYIIIAVVEKLGKEYKNSDLEGVARKSREGG